MCNKCILIYQALANFALRYFICSIIGGIQLPSKIASSPQQQRI